MSNNKTAKTDKVEASKPFNSLATETMQRALSSQGSEWFQFFSYRLIGWAIAFFILSHPLYLAHQYKDFLQT